MTNTNSRPDGVSKAPLESGQVADSGSPGGSVKRMRLGSRVVARTKQALRKRAEKKIQTDAPLTPEAVSVGEARHMIHELQVHQIELDMQNEELRRSQEELEISRARYFDLYDLSPAGYVTLNGKGVIEEANLTVASLLQSARGALIGQPITRYILPEDQLLYYFLRKRLLETGNPQAGDMRFVHPDGSTFWVNIQTTLQQSGQCWITLNDISEHKAIEEVLTFLSQCGVQTDGSNFFQSLTRFIGERLSMNFVCIDRLDDDGLSARTVAVWSDGKFEDNRVYALKDTPCGELVGKVVCCYPEGVCGLFPGDAMLRALSAESYTGVTLWDHKSKPIGLIAVIGRTPLSNRSLAESLLKTVAVRAGVELARLAVEEALQRAHEKLEERVLERTAELVITMSSLRESKARYQALVESTDDFVWETDREGVYAYASPRCMALLGYSPEQIVGRCPRDFAHPAKAAEFEFRVNKLIQGGAPFRGFERICRHREGHPVIVESSGVPFFDLLGDPAGLRGIDRDITMRKKLEAQALRTRHLAAIGELAAGVAHEINNPINGIINYAQVLEDEASASGGDPDIPRRIIKEGDRIANIVRNLLFFSRQEGGAKQPASIRMILEDSLALFAPQLRKEGIHVAVDIPDDIPLVTANPQQIQQVFVNILANSRHALSAKSNGFENGKRIEMKARLMGEMGGAMVVVGFYDNGIGIPPEMLEWVFDPFFTTKAAGEGTGLGLSISYGIVKDHGGNLVIESEPGKYTTALVYLPVSTAP